MEENKMCKKTIVYVLLRLYEESLIIIKMQMIRENRYHIDKT